MHQIIKKIAPKIPILLIIILAIFAAYQTYQPNTFLSGWDTLHPEFNLSFYFKRVFFGAWQEHQGLGAVASQAHLAELIRLPILFLLKLLFGIKNVRYLFILGMYVLGSISSYWYIRNVWFRKYKNNITIEIASAIGSLFYLFNLGTLQQFHVPLEMFAIHFATFGFVLGSVHLFIVTKHKKYAFYIFLSQLVAAPSAHTSTLFYMYTAILTGYALFLCLFQNQIKNSFKNLLLALILIISANFYWLIPNIYYISTNSKELETAKINRNFSDEAFWQNQAYGEIKNVFTYKSFLFNWKVFDFEKKVFVPMFNDWKHLDVIDSIWPYFLGLIYLIGVVSSLGKERKEQLPLLSIFLLGFLFLNNINFPLEKLYLFIVSLSDTLKEALRFPFTKFSIVFIFAGSVYFAAATQFILEKIYIFDDKLSRYILYTISILILLSTILYPAKPLLSGGLISNTMKVDIPQRYFDTFAWFEGQPESQRIAMFPMVDFWPWSYYDWSDKNGSYGYQGGGFMWFGFRQPLLNREFDRWASQNEYFYHEMNSALFQEDYQAFQNVLNKYDISWLIYDPHLVDPQEYNRKEESDIEIQKNTLHEFIQQSENITQEKVFDSIEVYFVEKQAKQEVRKIGSDQSKILNDYVYSENGDYIIDTNYSENYLFSYVKSELIDNSLEINNGALVLKTNIKNAKDINLANWNKTNSSLPVFVSAQTDGENLIITVENILPTINIDGETYDISGFANKSSVVFETKLEFEDDYYQTVISKNTAILDPTDSSTQTLGTGFITPNGNLEINIEASYSKQKQLVTIPAEILIELFPKEKIINLSNGKSEVYVTYSKEKLDKITTLINPAQTYFETNCSDRGNIEFIDEANSRILSAKNGGIACQGFLLKNLPGNDGYLVTMDLEHIAGPTPFVQANEFLKTKIFFQETPVEQVSYFGVFPENNNDLSFVLVNRSFGSYEAVSKLNQLTVTSLPFDYISQIKAQNEQNSLPILKELEPNTWDRYSFELTDHQAGIITLNQSFSKGWIAFSKDRLKLLPHYKLNTWANAWELQPKDTRIIVCFWPQIFVYIGFLLIIGTTIYLYFLTKKSKKIDRKAVKNLLLGKQKKNEKENLR